MSSKNIDLINSIEEIKDAALDLRHISEEFFNIKQSLTVTKRDILIISSVLLNAVRDLEDIANDE